MNKPFWVIFKIKKPAMKPFYFLFLLYANTVLAQTTIAADKMNVVYIGVDNPLSVAVADAALADISVTPSQGELKMQGKNGIWRVRDLKPSSIFVKNNKTAKIDTINFRVKRIPDPTASVLCNPTRMHSMYDDFRKDCFRIYADLRNFEFDAQCDIKTYTVSLVQKRGKTTTIANTGARFEPAALELIKSAIVGDTIYIENVKCHCPDEDFNRSINDIIYKIK
jgi:GldM C-terminal domain